MILVYRLFVTFALSTALVPNGLVLGSLRVGQGGPGADDSLWRPVGDPGTDPCEVIHTPSQVGC